MSCWPVYDEKETELEQMALEGLRYIPEHKDISLEMLEKNPELMKKGLEVFSFQQNRKTK